jgi:hypothetical protein
MSRGMNLSTGTWRAKCRATPHRQDARKKARERADHQEEEETAEARLAAGESSLCGKSKLHSEANEGRYLLGMQDTPEDVAAYYTMVRDEIHFRSSRHTDHAPGARCHRAIALTESAW